MDKSYRIHTNIAQDTLLQVNMQQDFDFLEVLSLKLRQKDAYRLHSSNYGVIIGRVLANDAFGIPNAKLSVFIERESGDTSDMEYMYPYTEVTTKDRDGRRYNLLPDSSDDDCYRVVGTFPNKRLVLDDETYLEIYDKYWRFTTVTNNAGDYMIFGVPTGSTTIHVDIDLSDIGVLSQKPSDFEYKGYNLSMFDSPTQFKESTNLDNLAQIFSQNQSVFVYPFWGDADNGIAAITRSDIQVQYKFEPTCVFMGSIVSDNEGHAIGHRCSPDIDNGMNNQLVGGNGTIEMIRRTPDDLVEEYQIQGNQLIDENGVWCYQIPMNLDFIGTDEYGNIVPTDNPNKGIATRAQVRFRFSKNETSDEGFSRHTAKYLVPMNPIFSEDEGEVILDNGTTQRCGTVPFISDDGANIEKMYSFGSSTPLHCFRDLYWNNVYSVKNYIPKSQVAQKGYSKNYTGLKGSNLADDQNPIPFNKLRVDIPFVYIILCLLFTIVTYIIWFVNEFIICTIDRILSIFHGIKNISILGFKPFDWLLVPPLLGCISLSAGISEGNVAYYPGCDCDGGIEASDCPEEMEGRCERSNNIGELLDKIQRNLALDFKIIKLDLYQDWINGCLYMPLWYWRKRKKKTFLFFTLSSAKNEYCSDKDIFSRLKSYVTCNIRYHDTSFTVSNNRDSMPDNEDRWHKNRGGRVWYNRGLIKPVENRDGLTAYYYVATQATSDNANPNSEMYRRHNNFKAVRLFATDIILLGNLNKDNIYGIPQFFTCLPSTTANMPPIATIEEIIDPQEPEVFYDKDTSGNAEDSGNTVTTGMDWNKDGKNMTPAYKTGLFMDLACTFVRTKPKSCINVERISELGVSLDMTYNMAYHEGGNSTMYGKIENDGFITKFELDDMENRAMFATMNHIGFIPQEYQDIHGYYSTQVYDRNTNYLIPKFKYIYPVDFDGRLQLPMDLYRNGFDQAMFDERDEAYITFRMGAERNANRNNNSEGRIRHFYNYDGRLYDMPLYNNSYYFYFGIKKGSTAIDKFNKMFYSPCFKQSKYPFTLDITAQGRSYCPEAYSTTSVCNCPPDSAITEDVLRNCRYDAEDARNSAYGYIRVTSEDIRIPYSYRLIDRFNDVIIEEDGMTAESFVIGGQIASGRTVSNCNGWIYKQVLNDNDEHERLPIDLEPYYTSGLTNQEYTLEVTDSDGKKITEKVKLEVPKILGEYKATRLGTKFYNSATTRIDYICHDDNAFYGVIEMTKFIVDGYDCTIKEVSYSGFNYDNESYVFKVRGTSDVSENVVAVLQITALSTTDENRMRNCMCDNNDNVNEIKARQGNVNMSINGTIESFFLKVDNNHAFFYFYQPNRYVVKLTQGCTDYDNLIEDNSSEEIVNIQNGEPFMTTLNTMPTKFMLGTTNDSVDGAVANNSHFYRTTVVTNATDNNISGWYGLHQEDSYMFDREENRTYNSNQKMWEDFFKGGTDSVASPEMKRRILKFKFDKMFALSEGAYVTNDSSLEFKFLASGGVPPILNRMVAPVYDDFEHLRDTYILRDYFRTQCVAYFPNIVGYNYSLPLENNYGYNPNGTPNPPSFNDAFYDNAEFLGNYFAAFTRDGSYVSKNTIDGNINIERSPSFASISPMRGVRFPKVKGENEFDDIYAFSLVHTKDSQTLEGDRARNVLPYLRAMYVDRRLDYDLTVFGPVVGNNFSLYINPNRNRVWKSGRLSGWTFNGIEMAYDNEYNIISANTEAVNTRTYAKTGEDTEGVQDLAYTAATANERLEYTYIYSCADICMTCGWQQENMGSACTRCGSTNINHFHGEHPLEQITTSERISTVDEYGNSKVVNKWRGIGHEDIDNAITIYHSGSTNSVWGRWNTNNGFGFNEGIDTEDANTPLIKQFYVSRIARLDIRHLYWSTFNEQRLNNYTNGGASQQIDGHGQSSINNPDNPFYVYNYPSGTMAYNGDFNRESVINNSNYPTKRFIDIGNLPPISRYTYEVASCTYAMNSFITDDGEIKAITDKGEGITINFDWDSPITVIPPNASSTDYANVEYHQIGCQNGYVRFTATTASMSFKYNKYTCNGFEVYTTTPRIIRVLPYVQGIDGIGYIKTVNPGGEFGGYGDGKTLTRAIADVTIHQFGQPIKAIWGLINIANDIYLPQNVELEEGYTTKYGIGVDGRFFRKNGEWLPSDDNDFTNIVFQQDRIDLNDARIFTILVEREFRYIENDNLVRHIHTVETSDIYDCRELLMRIATGTSTEPLTYVEMRQSAVEDIEGVNEDSMEKGTIHEEGEEGEEGKDVSVVTDAHDTVIGHNDTKIYIQTITFDMMFNTGDTIPIEDRQNEAFANYSMMSYTFRFFNLYEEQFDVVPSNVEIIEEPDVNILRFTLKWPVNMGIVADSQWSGIGMKSPIRVELYARTQSNFIYKLIFTMQFCCGQYVNGICKESTNVEEDIKAPMEPSPGKDGKPVRHLSYLILNPCVCN